MKKIAISRIVLVGIVAVASGSLRADSLPVGTPGDANQGDCSPFGCATNSTYQQLYDKSLFPGPITISGITFFVGNFDQAGFGIPSVIFPANYTLGFSIIAASSLSPSLADNIDPTTHQLFFSGPLGDGFTKITDQFTIDQNQGNFAYDPSLGNLLLQVTTDGSDPSLDMLMNVDLNFAKFAIGFDSDPHPASSDCNPAPGFANGATSGGDTQGCVQSGYGLVTQFETTSSTPPIDTVPEPASVTLLGSVALAAILIGRRRCIAR